MDNDDFFDPTINYEDQEAIERVKKDEKARMYLHTQNVQAFVQSQVNSGQTEALAELGITPQEFAQLAGRDPAGTGQLLKDVTKDYTRKVVERGRDSQGRFTTQSNPAQPLAREKVERTSGTYEEKISRLKQRKDSGDNVTDEDLLDALGGVLFT